MSDVQGMRALEEPAPPAANGGGGPGGQTTPLIAAYRQLLAEPRLENEFHTVKALAHRASSTGQEGQRLTDGAAAAEVEAGRLARADDEDLRPRLGFLTGSTLACLLAAIDAVPAFLAAQAFGLDQVPTIGITAVLVAGLACAMWAAAYYRMGWRRWLVISALGAGLVTIGLLRWWYLLVTATTLASTLDDASAVLEAAGLTIFTTLLIWLGVVVLGLTKARHVSRANSCVPRSRSDTLIAMKVRIGYGYGGLGVRPLRPGSYRSLVDGLENLGFDSIWLTERVNADTLDPVAGLAYAAGRTQRLKLGTAVMVLPGRNPVLLAKQLATLDQLSEGRLLPAFGLGIVNAQEQQAFGVRREDRPGWFEEALPLIRRLWAEDEVTHNGKRFHVERVAVRPKPVRGGLDVWLGGALPRELDRVGRLSNGWLPSFVTPSEAAAGRRLVEQSAARAGREIEDEHFGALVQYSLEPLTALEADRIRRRRERMGQVELDQLVPIGAGAVRSQLEKFVDRGFSKFVLMPVSQPDSWDDELAAVAEEVLPLQAGA